jgi:hypothetical protein
VGGQVKISREAALALVLATGIQRTAEPAAAPKPSDLLESPEAVALLLAVAAAQPVPPKQ